MAGRSRVNGVGRQQKQNKRAATSFQDKLEVIQHYEASRDMQATVLKFYPELNEAERRAKARVVYRWLQLKDAIATHANSAKTKNQSRIRHVGSATTLGVDGEKQLVAWLQQMRRSGEQVSTEMLRVKALAVAKERNVPEGAFAASGTWQKSFLDRNKKHLRDDADGGGDAGDTESDASGSAELGFEARSDGGGDDATSDNGGKPIRKSNASLRPRAQVKKSEIPVKQVPRTEPTQQPAAELSPQAEQQSVSATTAKTQSVELKRHEPAAIVPVPVPTAPATLIAAVAPAPHSVVTATTTATAPTPTVPPASALVLPIVAASPPRVASVVPPAPVPAPVTTKALAPAAVAPALPVVATPAVTRTPATATAAALAAAVTPAAVPSASSVAPTTSTTSRALALPAAASIATAVQLNSTPTKELLSAEDAEDRELRKRKAEIEDRKAELLNESIRCDNVLKKIRIAEENMFARKRLRDAGIPQEEIDAMLPVVRG